MLKFFSLSSGSCGNCYFLSDGRSGLLIDAGVSQRRLKKTLMEHGLGVDSFQAVLVTHDHLDHIRQLGSYCKHLKKACICDRRAARGSFASHIHKGLHLGLPLCPSG